MNSLYFNKRMLGTKTISTIEVMKIKDTHKEYTENIDLYYRNMIIPYSNSDNFYLLNINNTKDYQSLNMV